MKKLIVLVAAFLLASSTAFAADLSLLACSADKKEVTLAVTLSDMASDKIKADFQHAFTAAASAMTAEDLASQTGYEVFVSQLTEEDAAAFQDFPSGPPAVTGSCQ